MFTTALCLLLLFLHTFVVFINKIIVIVIVTQPDPTQYSTGPTQTSLEFWEGLFCPYFFNFVCRPTCRIVAYVSSLDHIIIRTLLLALSGSLLFCALQVSFMYVCISWSAQTTTKLTELFIYTFIGCSLFVVFFRQTS